MLLSVFDFGVTNYDGIMPGTFRPDRIRSIADRFGVDGNMALENILYGTDLHLLHSKRPLMIDWSPSSCIQ